MTLASIMNFLFQIGYFKIRDSSIVRLTDHVFMGLKIIHLMIYNSSERATVCQFHFFWSSTIIYYLLLFKISYQFFFQLSMWAVLSSLPTQILSLPLSPPELASLNGASLSSVASTLKHLVLSNNRLEKVNIWSKIRFVRFDHKLKMSQ